MPLSLRSPLGISSSSSSSTVSTAASSQQQEQQREGERVSDSNNNNNNNNNNNSRSHDAEELVLLLRPAVCGLCVASHVLQLSVEAQFTAACLLHRYCYYYFRDDSKQEEDVDDVDNDEERKDPASSRRRRRRSLLSRASSRSETAAPATADTEEWKWIVPACVFLACKMEEQPRRLRDIVSCASMIDWDELLKEQPQTPTPTTPGSAAQSAVLLKWNERPPDLDAEYWKAKEKIVRAEQHVLRWLQFDTVVSHPHRAVVLLVRQLLQHYYYRQQQRQSLSLLPRDDVELDRSKDDSSAEHFAAQCESEMIIQCAWRRLNDAMFSVDALRLPVVPLACGAVDLAIDEVVLAVRPTTIDSRTTEPLWGWTTTTTATTTAKNGPDPNAVGEGGACWWERILVAGKDGSSPSPSSPNQDDIRAAREALESATRSLMTEPTG